MKNIIATLLIAVAIVPAFTQTQTTTTTNGVYYDYLVVETPARDYLLDDSATSPYIRDNKVIFESGDRVQIVTTHDDSILTVRKIE